MKKKNIAVTVGLSLALAGAPLMPPVLAFAEDAPAVTETANETDGQDKGEGYPSWLWCLRCSSSPSSSPLR